MIKIESSRGKVTVTGHAGYDEKGRDIVCSAVSILLYTLVAALDDDVQDMRLEEGDSFVTWRVTKPANRAHDVISKGFRLLANTYKGYVSYTEE